ncbi:MAG: glycosyltransferase family 4 protein [Flavobacteriales bacterium]|nr:glycosyltransferase family 4 protein [Flavobacteriales bacterium]
MRIGFDAKRLFHNQTGLGNYSRDLVRILHQYYPENSYILFNPKPKKNPRFQLSSPQIIEINPKGFWKNIKSLWRSWGMSLAFKKLPLDIYHGLSGELPIGIPSNVKKIVTIHDLIFLRHPEWYNALDVKIHHKKFAYACKKADIIIAISEQTKRDIVHYLKVPEHKIEVIYQGCHEVFKHSFSVEEKKEFAQLHQLPKQFLLYVGTIEPRKNALEIVKAIQGTDYHLVLVGKKTKYFEQIQAFVQQHQMEHQLTVFRHLELAQLSMLYQLASIFIYPSHFEGFGIPILEALFCQTPVITNQEGVFPEVGGPNSYYVDVKQTNQLKHAIQHLMEHPELRDAMSIEGLRFAQKFNDDVIAKNWMALYQKLMQ